MTCNFFQPLNVAMQLRKRITAVGNGNIDVGNKAANRKPGASGPSRNCGAMAQQQCDSGRGTQSSPQKFVQLVGYRNPKPPPEALRSNPVMRKDIPVTE
jgi:hypothetical protein